MSRELTVSLSVFNLFLTELIMAISLKGCKSDNFEPHNSLKLSFTNIRGLRSNFVECESFLESNSLDKFGWLKWFLEFLCEGLSFFKPKGFCYSYTWSYSLCKVRSSFCTGHISRKLCQFLLMFLTGFTPLSVLLLLLYPQLSLSLCMVFDTVSSNIEPSFDQPICECVCLWRLSS